MKLLTKVLSLFALLSVFAMPALADKCKDPIVDEVSALSSGDRSQIERSMNALSEKGADVRVQVVDSYHRNAANAMNKSLDEYKGTMLEKCKSWQSADGGMKNNLILVLVAPKQKASGLYNGDQWKNAINPIRQQIYDASMNPNFREGKIGAGIVKGLDDVVDVVSVKPSQAGKPVTINHAADYSGLWTVFKWLLFLTVIGALAYAAFKVFGQKEARRGAQRNAQTERAKCTQSINGFETPYAVLSAKVEQSSVSAEWKARLNDMLAQAHGLYAAASTSYSALDRSANNPDTPRLSVEEYATMEKRYANVASQFAKADSTLEDIENALRAALRGDAIPTEASAKPKQDPEVGGSGTRSAPPPQTPQGSSTPRSDMGRNRGHGEHGHDHTTVVVHERDSGPDFVTGVIVGEMLGRDHHHHDDDRRGGRGDPVIATPDFDTPARHSRGEPSEGGGKAVDWGKSSEGSGSAQSFGKTTEGSGESSNWGGSTSSRSGTSY